MKILCFSDLHLHAFTQFSTRLPNGRNSRLQDQLNIVSQAKRIVQERGVEHVFFVGDWHHSRTRIDVDVYSAGFIAMRDLASSGAQVHMLRGNHDCYSRVGEVHSLEAFKSIVNVVDEPQVRVCGDIKVAMFPYTPEVEQLKSQLAQIKPGMLDLVFLHQGLREGAVGAYGATVHSELSIRDLPLDAVKYAILGDYHHRQWLADGKVHYCGSPLQLNFGEAGEDKAFTLIDTADWRMQSIPTEAPRFFNFNTPAEFAQAFAENRIRTDVDFIRCYYKSADEVPDDMRILEDRVWFEQEIPEVKALTRVTPEVASDDVTLLEAYIAQLDTKLNPQKLLEYGMELLSGAN